MNIEGQLPVLVDGPLTLASQAKILQHIQRRRADRSWDLDRDLSRTQKAQSLAFQSLVEDTLYDALLYHWWFLPENRPLIVKTYGRMMPFYARCRHIYNNRFIHWVEERLAGRYKLPVSAVKQVAAEQVERQQQGDSTVNLEPLHRSGSDAGLAAKNKKKFHAVDASSPVSPFIVNRVVARKLTRP